MDKQQAKLIKKAIESSVKTRLIIEFMPEKQEYRMTNTHWLFFLDIFEMQQVNLNLNKIALPTPMTNHKIVSYNRGVVNLECEFPQIHPILNGQEKAVVDVVYTPFIKCFNDSFDLRVLTPKDSEKYGQMPIMVNSGYIDGFNTCTFKTEPYENKNHIGPVFGCDTSGNLKCVVMPVHDNTVQFSYK